MLIAITVFRILERSVRGIGKIRTFRVILRQLVVLLNETLLFAWMENCLFSIKQPQVGATAPVNDLISPIWISGSSRPRRERRMLNGHWDSHHSLLEFETLDGDTGRIARPWLTVLLDRYSHCIVGFSLRTTQPSEESFLDAMRMGIKRKDELLARLDGIVHSWDCQGVPAAITTDVGRASCSEQLRAASEVLQFSLHFKPQRRHWLKRQIETWHNSLERFIDERPRPLSLEEASWIVAKWVVDIYHQGLDPTLGCTPAQMWNSGLQARPILRVVPDDLLNGDFRPITRGVHRPVAPAARVRVARTLTAR